jgi:hypothetical protein
LIGCSKGQLAMSEIKMRNLSTESQKSTDQLAKSANQSIQKRIGSKNVLDKDLQKFLIKKSKLAAYQLETQKMNFESISKKIVALCARIDIANNLKDKAQIDELLVMELIVLGRQAKEQLPALQKKQLECEIKIAGLNAEIGKIQKMIPIK